MISQCCILVYPRVYGLEQYGQLHTLEEIINQTDKCLVSLCSKTYVFEDKMTKYWSV